MKKLINEVKSAQKCDNLSDFVDTYFTEPIAMLFSRLFLKLKVHPNFITGLSMIFGVVGGLLLIVKNIWISLLAIVLIIISAIFDASDGQVARLGTKRYRFGRFIDGIGDSVVYIAIYVGLCIHLMTDNIPFTETKWGIWIWIFGIICGLFLHSQQARSADYLRSLHMYFINNKKGNELSRAKNLEVEYKSMDKLSVDKMFLKSYISYTKMQEKRTPNTQKLLDAIEMSSEQDKDLAMSEYGETSSKFIRLTNLLTFNLRSYVLFILVLLNLHFFIFPFVILVLCPIQIFLVKKYENLANGIYNKYYVGKVELENMGGSIE